MNKIGLNPYASKSGRLSSGHRTGKGQFSFQSQRKAMPKDKSEKDVKDPYNKNYNILPREIKDLSKWRERFWIMDQRT